MIENVKSLYTRRDLLIMWTRRDIRVRYKQSFLGAAWAVLQPLALMIVFTVVFSLLVRIPTGDVPYPLFSYTAVLPWTFFSTAITFGVSSLIGNINLVTKVYFPREILPLASIGASFVDFLIASVIFLGLMFFYRFPLSEKLVLVPLLLLIQMLLMGGVVLFAAAVNVFYRDVRFVIPLLLQIWLYATPIIYPVTLVPEKWLPLYMLNPMAGLIESYRAVALYDSWPDWRYLGLAAIVSLLAFVLGYGYFKRVEWEFADII